MRVLSITGNWNGMPIGCVARHYDESERLPERYIRKSKSKYRNHTSKLSEAQVYEVRAAGDSGESGQSIAKRMGIHESMVSLIVRRKRWTHLPEKEQRPTATITKMSQARRLRNHEGLSQEQIAARLGVSQTYVSRLLKNVEGRLCK